MTVDLTEQYDELKKEFANIIKELDTAKLFIDYLDGADKVIAALTKGMEPVGKPRKYEELKDYEKEYLQSIETQAVEAVNRICIAALPKALYAPSVRLLAEKLTETGSEGRGLSALFYHRAAELARNQIYSLMKIACSIVTNMKNVELAKKTLLDGAEQMINMELRLLNEEKKILGFLKGDSLTGEEGKSVRQILDGTYIEAEAQLNSYIKLRHENWYFLDISEDPDHPLPQFIKLLAIACKHGNIRNARGRLASIDNLEN